MPTSYANLRLAQPVDTNAPVAATLKVSARPESRLPLLLSFSQSALGQGNTFASFLHDMLALLDAADALDGLSSMVHASHGGYLSCVK
jgi:hypothetical protein